MRNKPVSCFDEGCLDGMTAAWLLFRLYPEAIFIPLSHPVSEEQRHKVFKEAARDKEIIIADYAPPPEKIAKLAECYKQVTICDHHATEINRYKGWKFPPNVTLHFDTSLCGAEIVYEKIVVPRLPFIKHDVSDLKERPDILNYVRMADLGLTEEPSYGPLVSFVDDYIPSDEEVYAAFLSLNCLKGISRDRIAAAGAKKHTQYLEDAERLLQGHQYVPIGFGDSRTLWVPIVKTDIRKPGGRFVADMACEWSGYNDSGLFLLSCTRKGVVNLSVRTNGSMHAGIIAQQLGAFGFAGGGHDKRGCAQFPERETVDFRTGKLLPAFKDLFPILDAGHKVIHNDPARHAKVHVDALAPRCPSRTLQTSSVLITGQSASPTELHPR